jgi:fatty acid desaturase
MKVGVRKLYPGGAKTVKMRKFTLCCLWTAWVFMMYLMFVVRTVPAWLTAGALIGLVVTRLAHESGHMQASTKPWLNRLMLWVAYVPVGPSLSWYYRHVISHHAHTNEDSDVDVRYIWMLDQVPQCLNWTKILGLPGLFIGACLELGVVQMLEFFVMRSVEGNPVYLSLGGLIPETIFFLAFHYMFGLPWYGYACVFLTAGGIFVPMSQIAHAIIYPDPAMHGSWAAKQMMACTNFAPRSSLWYHIAFGLTTQIDHHLFPSIGAHCYDDVHEKVVKPVAAKYNVPCYEISAQKGLSALWQRLLSGKAVPLL